MIHGLSEVTYYWLIKIIGKAWQKVKLTEWNEMKISIIGSPSPTKNFNFLKKYSFHSLCHLPGTILEKYLKKLTYLQPLCLIFTFRCWDMISLQNFKLYACRVTSVVSSFFFSVTCQKDNESLKNADSNCLVQGLSMRTSKVIRRQIQWMLEMRRKMLTQH